MNQAQQTSTDSHKSRRYKARTKLQQVKNNELQFHHNGSNESCKKLNRSCCRENNDTAHNKTRSNENVASENSRNAVRQLKERVTSCKQLKKTRWETTKWDYMGASNYELLVTKSGLIEHASEVSVLRSKFFLCLARVLDVLNEACRLIFFTWRQFFLLRRNLKQETCSVDCQKI